MHQMIAHADRSPINRDQSIDAPQHGGLARTRRTDDADDFAPGDVERDSPEHVDACEGLVDILERNDRPIGHDGPMIAHPHQ